MTQVITTETVQLKIESWHIIECFLYQSQGVAYVGIMYLQMASIMTQLLVIQKKQKASLMIQEEDLSRVSDLKSMLSDLCGLLSYLVISFLIFYLFMTF